MKRTIAQSWAPVYLQAIGNPNHTETAALYNMTDNTFKPYHIKESAFCSGQTLHPNGEGLIVGGEPVGTHTRSLPAMLACMLYKLTCPSSLLL